MNTIPEWYLIAFCFACLASSLVSRDGSDVSEPGQRTAVFLSTLAVVAAFWARFA